MVRIICEIRTGTIFSIGYTACDAEKSFIAGSLELDSAKNDFIDATHCALECS